MKPKIFISYRREDSADIAGRIADHLGIAFGEESIFVDVVNIPGGANFEQHIEEAIAGADVFLAVIGERWIGYFEQTTAKVDLPTISQKDYVLLEIRAALKAELKLIPVLVGSARMPDLANLPSDISTIATYNAACVRSGVDFRGHMQKLIACIEDAFQTDLDSGDVIVTIRFRRSGRTLRIKNPSKSILDIAGENGIRMDSGCRAGSCGTCLTAVSCGNVRYECEHAYPLEPGTCLPCIGIPVTNLELEA